MTTETTTETTAALLQTTRVGHAIVQATVASSRCPARGVIRAAVAGFQWSDVPAPQPDDDTPPRSTTPMHSIRPGMAYAIMPVTDLHPGYERMIAEAIAGDLLVYPADGTLYRRVQQYRDVPLDDQPGGFSPIASIDDEYGVDRRERQPAIDGLMVDALTTAGATIMRGMTWECADGRIVAWQTGLMEASYWSVAICRDGREPEVAASAAATGEPPIPSRPTTYQRRVDATIDEALASAHEARDIIRAWTGGPTGGKRTALMMCAAPYMRSHSEQAYVVQGPAGSGKSTFARALMNHMNKQATTFNLDLLTQPTAMSTENAMGRLGSHLLALSDDFDPRRGRFHRIEAPVKTLLTGLLPFDARRIGQDSVDGLTPQAVHVLTTNFPLPLGGDAALLRRFAYVVMADPDHDCLHRFHALESRLAPGAATVRERDVLGFWPFMLAGAMVWVETGGVHDSRVQPILDAASVSDDAEQIVRAIMDDGRITVADACGYRDWAAIGAVRTRVRVDGRLVTAYRAPREDEPTYDAWQAVAQAVASVQSDESEPAEPTPTVEPTPMPHDPQTEAVAEWMKLLQGGERHD